MLIAVSGLKCFDFPFTVALLSVLVIWATDIWYGGTVNLSTKERERLQGRRGGEVRLFYCELIFTFTFFNFFFFWGYKKKKSMKNEKNEKCLFSNTQEFLHIIFITSFK